MPSPTVMFTGHAVSANTAPGHGISAATHVATHIPVDTGRSGIQPWAKAPPARKQRTLVPIVLGGLLGLSVLLGGIALVLFFGKRSTAQNAAQETLSLPTSATPVASAPFQLTPALTATATAAASSASSVKAAAPPVAVAADPKPTAASAALPMVPAMPIAQPSPAPRAAAAQRCFADPFTGQVRLANAAHLADSFACKQNAFTGAFQRQ
jgi:hypothetical protein